MKLVVKVMKMKNNTPIKRKQLWRDSLGNYYVVVYAFPGYAACIYVKSIESVNFSNEYMRTKHTLIGNNYKEKDNEKY